MEFRPFPEAEQRILIFKDQVIRDGKDLLVGSRKTGLKICRNAGQYNRDLVAWERQVKGEEMPQQKPPEKESIRKKLRDMEAEAKRRNGARRQEPRHRSYSYDRGR